MLWSKQIYLFDVNLWLEGDNPSWPPPASRAGIRNTHWRHLNSMRVLSMPDKWEYPWFAAWDLAFHCAPLALIDPALAKEQLWLLLFEQFQHPSGQIPAYEWEFSDLNPPVHAWAVWRVYNMDRIRTGKADREFLEKCFHKLLINFAWWVNKVDRAGNNVFEGGFLGLDNITVIDRSEELPGGGGARAVRRHRLDGDVLPEPDAHRPRAGQGEPRLRGPGHQVLPALHLRRRGHEEDGRPPLPALGRGGRLLLRRAPLPGRQLPEVPRALAGRAHPALRRGAARGQVDRALPRVPGQPPLVPREQEAHRPGRLPSRRSATAPTRTSAPSSTRPRCKRAAPAHPGPGRVPVALRAAQPLAVPRAAALRARRQDGELRARGGGGQDQGRQLELARADLVSDVVPHDRVPAEARHRLRARR